MNTVESVLTDTLGGIMKKIIHSFLLIIVLTSCGPSIRYELEPFNPTNDPNKYEHGLIVYAEYVNAANGWDGTPELSLNGKYSDQILYSIKLTSNLFEEKSISEKTNLLRSLGIIGDEDPDNRVYYRIGDVTILSQGNTYSYFYREGADDQFFKNGDIFSSQPYVNKNGNFIGSWYDTDAGGRCAEIVIEKVGSSYQITRKCGDGSFETVTLITKNENGKLKFFENQENIDDEYMVIELGDLSFYNNQGLIKRLSPHSDSEY